MRIYVAGPLTADTPAQEQLNVLNAIDVADKLMKLGHFPYCPHLSWFWNNLYTSSYYQWLKLSMTWLKQCEALYYIASSPGADTELAYAKEHNMVIFYSMEYVNRA